MHKAVTLVLDAMSGDHGHETVVPAAVRSLLRHPNLALILVGDEPLLRRMLSGQGGKFADRLKIQHASQVVGMDESPSRALRGKKDSSMRVAINLLHEGRADACISSGNTGALMATARFVLKTLPGIDRPAIISAIPSVDGHTHMLDLGANAECTSEQLFQFAVMGSVLAEVVHGLHRPRIALLNIGTEEIKGNNQIQTAGRLLAASNLNYYGFVEGDDIFTGLVDVVVCDGFVGNVALKTSEGAGKLVSTFIREEFSRNWLTRVAGWMSTPVFNNLRKRVDPRKYNGASFLGLQGIVIKSHGDADEVAFSSAIDTAVLEVEKAVPHRISSLLASSLGEDQIA